MNLHAARLPANRAPLLASAGALGLAVVAGTYTSLRDFQLRGWMRSLDVVFSVPLAAVALLIVVAAFLPVILRDWRLGLWAFFAWLPFEDLIRKYAGNDIRVYAAKDLLFVLAMVSLAVHLRQQRAWQDATGRARPFLLALLGWSAALAVYASVTDWRVGVLGMRLNFLYVPLVAVGYFLATDRRRLRPTLVVITLVGTATVVLGIVQYVIGPSFLRPSVDTPGLTNLDYFRGFQSAAGSANQVFRPTGTFADPGRFAAMAVAVVAISLTSFAVHAGRDRASRWGRRIAVAGIVTGTVGMYVSGGRAPLLIGLTICVAFFVGPRIRGRSRVPRLLGMAAVAMAAAGLLVLVAPTQAANQVSFYAQSLDPTSEKSEWDWRWAAYTEGITLGIQKSTWLGRGAGTHSVGLQYLVGGSEYSVKAVGYEVESGWGAVAIELGKIGLALWVIWSIVWSRRLMSSLRALRGRADAQAALPLVAYVLLALFVLFFTGYQSFQNYIVNANIWLMSGIVFGMGAAATRTSGAEVGDAAGQVTDVVTQPASM